MPGADGRSRYARRVREAYAELARALGREVDAPTRALLFDAAVLVADSEAIAATPDPDARVRVSYALAEALRRLGLSPGAARQNAADPDPVAALRDHLAGTDR